MEKILVINAGSSSLKYKIFEKRDHKLQCIFEKHIDNFGKLIKNFQSLLEKEKILKNMEGIVAVGHRVVHGGERFIKPTRITSAVLHAIGTLSELAPLHNPANAACILAARKLFPKAVHIAVFDTSFHATMREQAYLYGLPFKLAQKLHIRRYGFHGISHQYVYEKARAKLGTKATEKTVTCHLGNGCSITAIQNGRVIDTSMGFTPLEGVPMGTRGGDLDPAIPLYLIKKGFKLKQVYALLNNQSGLLGVSGISSDVRTLWTQYRRGNKNAKRALHWFSYRAAKYIGAYTVALGGLDCLVYTGGIGEHAHYIRRWIAKFLRTCPPRKTLVIPTDEELQIAKEIGTSENCCNARKQAIYAEPYAGVRRTRKWRS